MLFISFSNLSNHRTSIGILGDVKEVSDSVLFRKADSVVSAELGSTHFARTCQSIMPLKKVLTRVLSVKVGVFVYKHLYPFFLWHILHILGKCIPLCGF